MSICRQVDRLRIRCRSDGQSRHQTVLLEDALRTASFPNLPKTGLVLIRTLDLGRVPLRTGSAALSRLIDERLLSVCPEIITLGSAEHPYAPVVWFADELEPLVVFAGLLARGVEPSSWYWQRLLTGWRCGMPRSDGARLVWQKITGLDSGITSLVHLVEALLAAELLVPFVELLPASELLLPALRAAPLNGPLAPRMPMSAPILESISPAWQQALFSVPADSAHASWLARAALAASFPPADQSMHAALLTELAARLNGDNLLTSSASGAFDLHGSTVTGMTAHVPGYLVDTPQNVMSDANQLSHRNGARIQSHDRSGSPAESRLDPHPHVDSQLIHAAGIDNFRGLSSANAGFALLVRLLQLLDIEDTLEQMAGSGQVCLPFLILRAAAQRLGIDEDDPVLAFIPAAIPLESTLVFQPPQRWAGLFTVAGGTRVSVELAVGAWLLAVARFLRSHARLSIGNLVRRSGLVAVSRTHLDIVFSSELVDLRIRRAGLDFDPGWVPWLGRVVSVHYEYLHINPVR